MYEEVPERLVSVLTAVFGNEPGWEVTPGRSGVLYVRYTDGGPSMEQIRAVIEQTVPFRVGVILARRP